MNIAMLMTVVVFRFFVVVVVVVVFWGGGVRLPLAVINTLIMMAVIASHDVNTASADKHFIIYDQCVQYHILMAMLFIRQVQNENRPALI